MSLSSFSTKKKNVSTSVIQKSAVEKRNFHDKTPVSGSKALCVNRFFQQISDFDVNISCFNDSCNISTMFYYYESKKITCKNVLLADYFVYKNSCLQTISTFEKYIRKKRLIYDSESLCVCVTPACAQVSARLSLFTPHPAIGSSINNFCVFYAANRSLFWSLLPSEVSNRRYWSDKSGSCSLESLEKP